MKIPEQYRRSVLIAVFLHLALIIFLIVRLSPTLYRAPNAYQPKPFDSIKAVAILPSQTQVPQKVNTQKEAIEKQQEKQAQEQQQEKLQKQAQQEKQEKLEKIEKQQAAEKMQVEKLQAEKLQQVAQLQAQQEKAAQLQKIKQQQIQKQQAIAKAAQVLQQKAAAKLVEDKKAKALALKLQQQKLAKLAKQTMLTAEQKKLQQEMMQQQLSSEQKDLSQIITKAQQGKIDQYKAQILALIQSNWRIDQVNSQLKCVYSVEVAPDGEVLMAQLVKSSGDDALDQSARQAIMASSPLPVPKNPALFGHFRQLVLTLSPQGYLQSAG